MAKKKTSASGKAEATGSNYETLVGAWYCHGILLAGTVDSILELPSVVEITSASFQTTAAVDDVNAYTSHDGTIFVQAKRTLALSQSANSMLAKTVDQFVGLCKRGGEMASDANSARALDPTRDRVVLATRSQSSSKITHVLPELLRRLRDQSTVRSLKKVAHSQTERLVAKTIENQIKRAWKTEYGKQPTPDEMSALLRLVWIQVLDLETGERDRTAILTAIRTNLLEKPSQAPTVFSELCRLVGRLRAERSGTDKPTLTRVLITAGISLLVLPDYRQDVVALEKWTTRQLQTASRFTRLLESVPTSTIKRTISAPLETAALSQSLLLVGTPGAGKSGLSYLLAEQAKKNGNDVILLPVDLLAIETRSGLQSELGITHGLADVLANWPGTKPGLVIVDALDAARKLETQRVLRDVIAEIMRSSGQRWHVVASVRTYELRQGQEWAKLFAGIPPIVSATDAEFRHVRHVAVRELSDDEIEQTAQAIPVLHMLYQQAPPKLQYLLKNAFNLRLFAELLSSSVPMATLSAIRTQPELLDSYWRHRIRRDDGKHDQREIALTAVTDEMMNTRSLQAPRSIVGQHVNAESLVDLESHDVLRSGNQGGAIDEDILLFSHHVLFDYAVARLKFFRGRDANALIGLLKAQRDLVVMVAPSLSMALLDTWNDGAGRPLFWKLAIALAKEDGLPSVARLAAPMIAAELASDITDLDPVIDMLTVGHPNKVAAENFLQTLIGAILMRRNGGISLTGAQAGPWMKLAARLAQTANPQVVGAVRVLLANALDRI